MIRSTGVRHVNHASVTGERKVNLTKKTGVTKKMRRNVFPEVTGENTYGAISFKIKNFFKEGILSIVPSV